MADSPVRVNLKIDTSRFQQALREYAEVNRREMSEIVKEKALDLGFRAIQSTKKANAAQMTRELRAADTRTVRSKNGQREIKSRLIYRLTNAEIMRRGGRPVAGAKMADAAKRFLARRKSSIAFIRSGWLYPVEVLSRLSGRPMRRRPPKDTRDYGRPNGAIGYNLIGDNPNVTMISRTAASSKALKVATDGLVKAMNGMVHHMEVYTNRKLAEIARRFSR